MAWAFQSILARIFSIPNNKAFFQADMYKKITPRNANAIIAASHCPNHVMHKISILVNHLPIHFMRRMILIRISLCLRIPTENTNVYYHLPFLYYTPVILPNS